MRFNKKLANYYRRYGNMTIVLDPKTGYYDIYLKRINRRREFVKAVRNRAVAKKIARTMAMTECVGFDEQIDVIF